MSEEWKWSVLSELANLTGGFAFKSRDYASEGCLVLRTLNIREDGSISREGGVYLPEKLVSQYSNFELADGDTLFVMVGATLGKVGYIRSADLPALLNQNMWLIRAVNEVVDPLFLNYTFRECVKTRMGRAGGSARGFVRREDFRSLPIHLPPLPEQKAIAAILSTWDRAIEQVSKLIEAKTRLKKGLMQQLLTGKKRFNEFKGKKWTTCVIKDIAAVNKETLSENHNGEYEFTYIDLSSVDKGVIAFPSTKTIYSSAPSRARRIVHKHDVLMSTVRPNLQAFALIDFEPLDIICSTGFAVITPNDKQDAAFLFQQLFSHSVTEQVRGLVVGSSYPAINAGDVEELQIDAASCVKERYHISNLFATLDREINFLRAQVLSISSQKQALMQVLLTGKVRVKTDDKAKSKGGKR